MKKLLILFTIHGLLFTASSQQVQWTTTTANGDTVRPVKSTQGLLLPFLKFTDGSVMTIAGAPANAPYITQTPNATLSGEQALSLLGTGLLKNTTGTGVLSIALGGGDYEYPLVFNAPLSRSTNTISADTSTAVTGLATLYQMSLKANKSVTLTGGYGISAIGDLSANRTILSDTTNATATSNRTGYLSYVDWNTFNSKQSALTTGNLTANSPISLSATRQVIGGAAAISVDTTSASGLATQADIALKANSADLGTLAYGDSAYWRSTIDAKKDKSDSTNATTGYATLYQNSLKANKSVTVTGQAPLGGGGDLTANRTITADTSTAVIGLATLYRLSQKQAYADTNTTDATRAWVQSQNYLTGNQTITLSGDVNGSGATAITTTVADDSHNHGIGTLTGIQDSLDARVRYIDSSAVYYTRYRADSLLNLKANKSLTLGNGFGINPIGDLSANRTISADTTDVADADNSGFLLYSDFNLFTTGYNERRQWDGGSANLNAATGRASLGLGSMAVLDSSRLFVWYKQGASAVKDSIRFVEGSNITLTQSGNSLTIAASGSVGEANTASNLSGTGVGLFKQKSGVDLEFKRLKAASNKITVTDQTDSVHVDVNEGNLTLSNLGGAVTDAQVPNSITLDNVTQITTRPLTSLTGTLGSTQLSGTYSEALRFSNAANDVFGDTVYARHIVADTLTIGNNVRVDTAFVDMDTLKLRVGGIDYKSYKNTPAGGGGGAPTDAGYVVTAANATLTNEVVVSKIQEAYLQLPVQSAKLPTTNPPLIDAGEGNWRMLHNADSLTQATWQFVMPQDYGTPDSLIVLYSMASATSGKAVFTTSVMAVTPGDAADIATDSYGTAMVDSVTVPGTAGYLGRSAIALSQMDGATALDYLKVKFGRQGNSASDTATGNAEVVAIMVRYRKQ